MYSSQLYSKKVRGYKQLELTKHTHKMIAFDRNCENICTEKENSLRKMEEYLGWADWLTAEEY